MRYIAENGQSLVVELEFSEIQFIMTALAFIVSKAKDDDSVTHDRDRYSELRSALFDAAYGNQRFLRYRNDYWDKVIANLRAKTER